MQYQEQAYLYKKDLFSHCLVCALQKGRRQHWNPTSTFKSNFLSPKHQNLSFGSVGVVCASRGKLNYTTSAFKKCSRKEKTGRREQYREEKWIAKQSLVICTNSIAVEMLDANVNFRHAARSVSGSVRRGDHVSARGAYNPRLPLFN